VDLSSNTNVIIQPSVDALMEFKVETNSYSALWNKGAHLIEAGGEYRWVRSH
jgi:hypothetical protein